jgi:hypothetical protein
MTISLGISYKEDKMTRKNLLTGAFGIMLVFLGVNALYAEKNEYGGLQKRLFLYDEAFFDIEVLADDPAAGYQDYTFGERAAHFGLNFVFGFADFSKGYTARGGLIATFEVLGIGAMILPSILGWDNAATISTENFLGYTAYAFGGIFLGSSLLINGFGSFLGIHKPLAKTARLDDMRNWQAAFYPDHDGNIAGRLAFTAHF